MSSFIQSENDAKALASSSEIFSYLLSTLQTIGGWDKVVILSTLANLASSSDEIVEELRRRNFVDYLKDILCSPSPFADPGDHAEAARCLFQILIASDENYKKSISENKELLESMSMEDWV